jgi:methionyl-tRNA synthetase
MDETALFWLILVWSFAWKGPALWRAARVGQVTWFIVLFIVQTAGILEILYLFVFSRSKQVVG